MWAQTDEGWINLDHVISIERGMPEGSWRWRFVLVDGRRVEGSTIFTATAELHQQEMEIISDIITEEKNAAA